MYKYLEATEYIDWGNPAILAQAKKLTEGSTSSGETTRKCFEFVRDETKHSWGYKQNPVTCKALDVLNHGTGYCYAKSHLELTLIKRSPIDGQFLRF